MTTFTQKPPSAHGVAAGGIIDYLDALDQAGIEMHSLMVLRHGDVLAQGWWAPYSPQRRHLLYSLSKSFTSLAAGMAVHEGAFALSDRVVDLLPDLVPAQVPPRVDQITVRHLLSMSTGHEQDAIDPASALVDPMDPDLVRAFLTLAPQRDPGTLFTYNQLATHTVARLVEEHAGTRLLEYLRPRLFDPLGITEPAWKDLAGRDLGFSGLHAPTDAIAALGQLVLQGGRWGEQQLVPADWIEAATRVQQRNDAPEFTIAPAGANVSPDWSAGYGFQFWVGRHGFRGDGAFGQFCLVWPQEDVVVVTTACTEAMDVQLDLAYRHLLPAVRGQGTVGLDADDVLATRLGGLSIRRPRHLGGDVTGTFERVGETGAAPRAHTLTVQAHPHGWAVRLGGVHCPAGESAPDQEPALPIGQEQWLEGVWPGTNVPFVSAGGVGADGVFEAHLRMIETPHHLVLRTQPGAGTFTLGWNTVPLHGGEPSVHALAPITTPMS